MVTQPYDPQQQFLLPPALQEWLPEGHLAYFGGAGAVPTFGHVLIANARWQSLFRLLEHDLITNATSSDSRVDQVMVTDAMGRATG